MEIKLQTTFFLHVEHPPRASLHPNFLSHVYLDHLSFPKNVLSLFLKESYLCQDRVQMKSCLPNGKLYVYLNSHCVRYKKLPVPAHKETCLIILSFANV